jgi:hypothetical protein
MSMFQLDQLKEKGVPEIDTIEVTLDNAGSKTAFELRSWLVREKEFNDKDFHSVNVKTLMQKCVQVLLKRREDKLKLIEETREKKEESGEIETLAAKLARQKAERKQAAIERSKARQADPDYFAGVVKATEEGQAVVEDFKKNEAETVQILEEGEDPHPPDEGTNNDDPFRPDYLKGSRQKIFSR